MTTIPFNALSFVQRNCCITSRDSFLSLITSLTSFVGLEGSGGSGLGGRMSSAALGQSHSHSHSHLQSPLQALVACTLPRELHEDIQELGKLKPSS